MVRIELSDCTFETPVANGLGNGRKKGLADAIFIFILKFEGGFRPNSFAATSINI